MKRITKKQLKYLYTNHINDKLNSIGLSVNDLTKKQARKIIANHKANKQKTSANRCSLSSAEIKLTEDIYHGPRFGRSWCGS